MQPLRALCAPDPRASQHIPEPLSCVRLVSTASAPAGFDLSRGERFGLDRDGEVGLVHAVGSMFWLRWKTLSGSHFRFSATSRSQFGPYAVRTRSGSSAL